MFGRGLGSVGRGVTIEKNYIMYYIWEVTEEL